MSEVNVDFHLRWKQLDVAHVAAQEEQGRALRAGDTRGVIAAEARLKQLGEERRALGRAATIVNQGADMAAVEAGRQQMLHQENERVIAAVAERIRELTTALRGMQKQLPKMTAHAATVSVTGLQRDIAEARARYRRLTGYDFAG